MKVFIFEELNKMSREDLLKFSIGVFSLTLLMDFDNLWAKAIQVRGGEYGEPAEEVKEAIDFTIDVLSKDLENARTEFNQKN